MKIRKAGHRCRNSILAAALLIALPLLAPAASPAAATPLSEQISGPSVWTLRVTGDAAARSGVPEARYVTIDRPAGPLPGAIRLGGVPTGPSRTSEFLLEEFDAFTPDARIVAVTGHGEVTVPRPTSKVYRGRSTDGTADAFLGVDGNSIQLMLNVGGETHFVMPLEGDDGRLVMAKSSSLRPPTVESPCAIDLVPENRAFLEAWPEFERRTSERVATTTILEADFMVDVNQSLYAGPFGSSTVNATNYMNLLYGAASAIYLRDLNVRLRIASLTIWTVADPFSGGSSSAQLVAYRDWCNTNRTGVTRDLAHLFANGNITNYGGIAYLNVLCNGTFGYGVSNIYGGVSFPTANYQWDIEVTSHEIGHNFGSNHTHCFSPPIDMCYGTEPGCYSGPSVPTNGTVMSYCHLTSGGITMVFHQRCIDVMRPIAEAASCVIPTPNVARDTVGIFVPASSAFFMRNAHLPGPSDLLVSFGPAGAGWIPIMGDWNNDGIDTPGLYVPSTGTFFLKNSHSGGAADIAFGYGPPASGWLPVAGDWNGDGTDSVGLYNPANGTFFLRNSLSPGPADRVYGFGPGGLGWRPVAGDWDGDLIDTAGVYDPANSVFYLRNVHAPGPANSVVGFGPPASGWIPVVGDWNGDTKTSIGLYVPGTGTFFLKNLLTPGAADLVYTFGGAGMTPISGNWDGN